MSDSINYGRMMRQAMHGLLAEVLRSVASGGLPGEHHFYITFDTDADGVKIPDWLHERYPGEMKIVMQEWFDDLVVNNDGFSITLNFGGDQVGLTIPFDAITMFLDPSVDFGLRFDSMDDDEETSESPMVEIDEESREDADVVSLDTFRK